MFEDLATREKRSEEENGYVADAIHLLIMSPAWFDEPPFFCKMFLSNIEYYVRFHSIIICINS